MIGCVLYAYWAQLLVSNAFFYLFAVMFFACLCEVVDIVILKISILLSTLTNNLYNKVIILL